MRLYTLARYLVPSSLVYLAIPFIIFVVGWLKWYIALFYVSLIVLSLFFSIRKIACSKEVHERPDEIILSRRTIILIFFAGVFFLGISGVGGVGYQDTDWIKHNAILKDLIERPWPVVYRLEGQDFPLVYYLAYYLPSALLGKLWGWNLANQALFCWSLIGLFLAILWFLVLNRRSTIAAVFLFLMFSGLDVIGELISRWAIVPLQPEVLSLLKWDHIEQWSVGWQYSSNLTLLFWTPHQALAGWIATAVLLDNIFYSRIKNYSLFIVGLTALWSPFVTIGLFPYALMEFLLGGGSLSRRLKQYISVPNICGLFLLAVVGFYYGSKLMAISLLPGGNMPHGFSLSFVPDPGAKAIGLILMLVFCILEFGLYSIFIIGSIPKPDNKIKAVFFTTLASLLLIPLYRFGGVNDFVMRASIPALFDLAIYLGRAFFSQSLMGLKRIALIAIFMLGTVTAVIEIRRHVSGIYNTGMLVQTPQSSRVMSIDHWGLATSEDVTILLQYVGSSQTPFFEFMAKGN